MSIKKYVKNRLDHPYPKFAVLYNAQMYKTVEPILDVELIPYKLTWVEGSQVELAGWDSSRQASA